MYLRASIEHAYTLIIFIREISSHITTIVYNLKFRIFLKCKTSKIKIKNSNQIFQIKKFKKCKNFMRTAIIFNGDKR